MTRSEGGVFLASKDKLTLKVTDTFLLLRTRREACAAVELGGTDDFVRHKKFRCTGLVGRQCRQ